MAALSECFQNKLVDTIHFMENLNSKDSAEKDTFFRNMPTLAEQLPSQIVLEKLLPLLASALDIDAVIPPALTVLLKIGAWLSAEEFRDKVLPTIVKLFASNDQAIRVTLLQHIDQFGELLSSQVLSSQVVEEQVYPHVASGFSSPSAILRELTLTSMLVLAPKLSKLTISGSLLKFLSELEVDKEPEIRKCTTSKLASHLNGGTRNEVLLKAFAVRALEDSFSFVKTAENKPELGVMFLKAIFPGHKSDVQSKAIHAVDHFWQILKQQHHEKTDGGDTGGASRIGIPSIAGNASITGCFAMDVELDKKLRIARGGDKGRNNCFAMDMELDRRLRIARGGDKGRNNIVPIGPDNVRKLEIAGGKFCDRMPPVTGGRYGTVRIHFKSLQYDVILPVDEFHLFRCFAMDIELDRRLRFARGGVKGRNNIVPIGPDNVRKLEIAGGKFCDRTPPVTGGRYGTIRIHFKSLQYDVILPVDEFHLLRCRWLNDYFENNPRCKKSFKPYFQCECDGYPSHPGLDPCFDCASFQRQRNCGKKAAVSEVLELEECGSASAIPTEQDTTQGRRRKKVNAGVKTKSQRGKAEGS